MSLDARAKPFPVARPMSLDNVMELVPVDLAKIVMTALFIPCQAGIGYGQAKIFRLGNGLITHFLAQLVVGKQLDAPLPGLPDVVRFGSGRAESHQSRHTQDT